MPQKKSDWVESHGYRFWRQGMRYRMNPDQLDALLASQIWMCKICLTDIGGEIKFSIDHDYKCCGSAAKKVTCGKCTRSALCQSCNLMVGGIEKAIRLGLLDKILEYVGHSQNNKILDMIERAGDEWIEGQSTWKEDA